MRLLYVSSVVAPERTAEAIRAAAHIRSLEQSGHQVSIITGNWQAVSRTGLRVSGSVKHVRASVPLNTQRVLSRTITELRLGLSLAFAILFSPRVDAVIISSPPFLMAAICAGSAFLRSRPVLLDIRDRYPAVLFSLGVVSSRSLAGRALSSLEMALYRRAAGVATVTPALAAEVEHDTGVSATVVMNGYRAFSRAQSLPSPPHRDGPVTVVMHGNFSKFFDEIAFEQFLVAASRRDLPIRVTVVGSGGKIPLLLGLERRFGFLSVLPEVDWSAIEELLLSAHFGLSIHHDTPSMRGAFPVKVFEYIGAGIPSIVLPENATATVMNDNGLGISVMSSEIDRAVDYIERLTVEPERYLEVQRRIVASRDRYSRAHQAGLFCRWAEATIRPRTRSEV